MQKILLTTILFLLISLVSLSAAPLMNISQSVEVDEVALSWESVDGAVYYDIYNDQTALARLDSSTFEYNAVIGQNESYTILIGARDENNNTLAAGRVTGTTTSYEGVYEWVNPTDKDNHGKVTHIRMRTELAFNDRYGEYMKIYFVNEDGSEELFFPLFDLDSTSWPWIEYDSDNTIAKTYRDTAARFNTSSIKPKRFRLERITLDRNMVSVDIRTRALGIEVVTTTIFEFGYDEEGAYLKYSTTGSGVAKTAIFKNPEGGDDPYAFILRPLAE